jgi:alcohol dehydrogenase YqhD (iron-dependent ADH family)
MQNFVFHNPTKILFGRNTVPALGNETGEYGKNVLLLYGQQSVKNNGLYDKATTSLQNAGISFIEHGGVQSNPLLGHVREGIHKVKQHNLEAIVAIGGGSVIDSAKAIAAGSVVAHDVWKFFTGKKSIKAALPVITVLTLAASGSEMNSGMVLTNEDSKEKFGFGHRLLYPKTSILDPEITYTVPPDYTAFGAIDAISHVLEFYMTTQDPDTPVQDRLMEGIILNSMESCERCLKNPLEYNARANLMWTATLALNGLTAAGLGRVGFPMHMIEHSLSALYNVAHGAGLSVVIPGWLEWICQKKSARIAMLGRHIFAESISDSLADTDAAAKTISLLRNWFSLVNSPVTLGELNILAADIPHIAKNSMGLARFWRLQEYSQQKVEDILRLCQ